MEEIIVIVGPTGVGKTKLSIELAKDINAEIINGDSVAIYKELNIGSAKPSILEREGITHHLLDVRNVLEDYSVFDYQRDVRELIKEISSRGKRIIIVGGTGLYIKAALYDYNFTPNTTVKSYDELSNQEIVLKIKSYKVDVIPDMNNRRRLVRLLNKLENQEDITYNKDRCLYPIKVIGLTTDRDTLYKRINDRVDKMVDDGLLQEVQSLKDKYHDSRILNSGIGYKEFYDYFFNNKDLDSVIDSVKQDSRRFAKRQYTFFKHQFPTTWYEVDFNNFNKTISEVLKDIKKETN